ncbi:smoothelin-like protein 1 isoform X2 [Actinia tenebrosa]|nr:smoothelin-like protein 1 isoform X2 [Actinia tenebrosa]XP_031556048.1 smoothelin-like protein 1 isoform X2 [Actinia tenebrosa]
MNRPSENFEKKSKNYVEPVQASLKNESKEVRVTRSTYKFEMSSSKVETETRRHQINQNNGSAVEEKRPRKDQDYNNNNQENMDRGSVAVAPQRMSRRKSLVELFKIDEDAKGGRKARMAQPDIPESARLPVSGPPSSRRDVIKQDDQTKKDLIQNLGRLRSRRRSVREIQNRDELEGLMYVKQGDSVKLVSTSEGDEQVKEQRRIRRTSRKEMQDKFRVEGNTISYQDKKEETLSPLKEESPSPASATKRFSYGTNSVNKPERTNSFGRNEPPRPAPQPGRIGGRPGSTGPKSFFPGKEEASAPAKLTGSVADRMKYFREQAELEKKQASKQKPVKKVPPPSPTPVSNAPPTPPATNDNKERVSLKKAPDPNKTPRDLKKKPPLKRQMSVSSLILTWCKDVTAGYPGVNITNFSGSFANGLAFCALIHKFNPDKFDFNSLNAEDRWNNFQLAFDTASSVGIPALLDVEDMFRLKKPEPRSVQCYVQMIFSKYRPKDLDMSNLRIA